MKRSNRKLITFLVFSLTASVIVSSCTITDNSRNSAQDQHQRSNYQSREQRERNELESGKFHTLPSASYSFSNDGAPEITGVTVYTTCDGRNLQDIYVDDLYRIDVYNSDVAGRVGSPFEIDYPDDLQRITVEFTYDEDALRGIDEANMSLIHFNENSGFYNNVVNVLNTDTNTLAFHPEEPGVYIMISAPSWADVLSGNYTSPDYTEYESDWERNFDTGDIMQLADTQWALDNAPNFYVSTPEQLAGVVWYSNVCASGTEYLEINIMDDIDLAGYDWAPMGTYGVGTQSFRGTINGNEHIINNMTIDETGGGQNVGFIGHSSSLTIMNLGFLNAHVSGGRYTGIVGGQIYGTPYLVNVYVTGEVEGSGEAGTILGRECGAQYENCFIDVTVNGEPNEYFSHYLEHINTAQIEEVVEVTLSSDGICTINRLPGCPERILLHIEINGETVRSTGCDEDIYNLFEEFPPQRGDVYTVYTTSHDGMYYIRCSNIAEIEAE